MPKAERVDRTGWAAAGQAVRAIRNAKGWTLLEYATKVGGHKASWLYKIEIGENRPDPIDIERLCDVASTGQAVVDHLLFQWWGIRGAHKVAVSGIAAQCPIHGAFITQCPDCAEVRDV